MSSVTSETFKAGDTPLPGLKQFGLIAAALGVVLTGAGFMMAGEQGAERFFQAYLVAYTFWTGVALGCLALLMVQHLTGGAWGIVLRRPFEAAVRTIPFMAVLFLPIALGMHHLYEWTHDSALTDPVLMQKAAYLNTPFFLVRQVIYFAIWSALGYLLTSWSAEHDRTGDPKLVDKMASLSGAALVLDHLGHALHRRPGPVGLRVRHHGAGDAVADRAVE